MCIFAARDWKNCATCEYWVGPRTLDDRQQAAEADGMAVGACRLQKGHVRKYATSSCYHWRRWSRLGGTPPAGAAAGRPASPVA